MSMNVYADLGFENPELEQAKSRVIHTLYRRMNAHELSYVAFAPLLGLTAHELDEILDGHWDDYSLDQLIAFVHVLDPDIRFDPDTGEELTEAAPLALVS